MESAPVLFRQLGLAERYLWRIDRISCLNTAAMATVSGVFDETRLRGALEEIQHRQPLYRAAIVVDKNGHPRLEPRSACPIALTIRDCAPTAWQAEIQRWLAVPFSEAEAPLLRWVWLRGNSVSLVALIAHHTIMDGRSLTYLMKTLFAHLSDRPLKDREHAPALPEPVEQRYPTVFRGASGLLGWEKCWAWGV
ncbi:MAG: hypothetical protein FJY97_03840 [candidate division Zixibacteria bacterium]|nr:hypothetical protein [candidate division Zixibacteria bacterium]